MASSNTSPNPVWVRSFGVSRGRKVDRMERARERVRVSVESRRVRSGGT